jgi:hypothetical protein
MGQEILPTKLEGALPKGRGFIANSPPLMCQISLPSSDQAFCLIGLIALLGACIVRRYNST